MAAAPDRPPSTNRLIASKSPYLLQYAHNPVDWYPWGDEAFDRARAEHRPVFLSIGYSTCHWCHVMEKESFEDADVARLLNETFVCVKVDREERPDIDDAYMTACQALTGAGGWPLTLILTPDRDPIFAATYIPRETRFGRIGLLDLIPRVARLWRERRDDLVAQGRQIASALAGAVAAPGGEAVDAGVLDAAVEQFRAQFDPEHGGFGGAPKFPSPHALVFLLRAWHRTREPDTLEMAERTLLAMRQGGLCDPVGGGFHRYATDAAWRVPHFEKMLYDQALLTLAYVEAHQATRRAEYADAARETLAYVLRDLAAPEGGFFCAEDADSEGEEGRFYTWTLDELRAALGAEEAAFAADIFHATEAGNYRDEASGRATGRNILYRGESDEETARRLGVPLDAFRARLERVRRGLFAARQRRVRPHRDEKVLTDWNGLMIAALARAGRALGEPAYVDAAERAARFVRERLSRPHGRLLHRYADGEAAVPAFLDDYAFLAWGLIELYEAAFDASHLEAALALKDEILAHFEDRAAGGFFLSADDAEPLLVRRKPAYDGAVPSGNSVAMLVLVRLARLTGDAALEARAAAVGRAFGEEVRRAPMHYAQMLLAADWALGPSEEVVVVGEPGADDAAALLRVADEVYAPRASVLFRPTGPMGEQIGRLAPFSEALRPVGGRAAAYLCRGGACALATTDPADLRRRLGAASG